MSGDESGDVLIVTRRDVAQAMAPADYLAAMDSAFRAAASGTASTPEPMHLPVPRGGFHAKGASISLDRAYVAVKINGNFPGNPSELGLPTVQGAIVLADGSNGRLLAVLDSIEITLRRTAAASALAARTLARKDSNTLLICGCGQQGRAHLASLCEVLPLQRCLLWDREPEAAQSLAEEVMRTYGIEVTAVPDLEAALSVDVIATCTSARKPFLDARLVRPGTFVTAVGADSPEKNELAPKLMAAAKIVTDVTSQCAQMGDLRHALDARTVDITDVYAELGQIVVGDRPGRRSPEEIIIFDSTGAGFQDVAAAAAVYRRCREARSILSAALAEA